MKIICNVLGFFRKGCCLQIKGWLKFVVPIKVRTAAYAINHFK